MSDAPARLNAALEGRYAIERELGEGGMATVYLAADVRHERKVALKVLKPELAAVVGADRFLAEIKTTAHLQHPHIVPLHDSGEADGFVYYVMPYVEGHTLRDRLEHEHQLPVDDAVRMASEMAEALDYAHRHDVIHRDIKPANVLIADGRPMIADFGISLALSTVGRGRLTETGLNLGTPRYMSPEQAIGDEHVGAATDTYSLGCVLYEMLVGDPPYTGSTAQAILGKIMKGSPKSVTAQRTSVPANVDAAIAKALEKLPADRFTRTQDFATALADPGFRHGEKGEGVAVGRGTWNPLYVVTTVLTAGLALAFGWSMPRPDPPRPVMRLSIHIPEDQSFGPAGDFDLSADGSLMVYLGVGDEGRSRLWARPLDELDAMPIPDTDDATTPAISPDGREVAFVVRRSIRVAPLQGGVSRTVVEGSASYPRWSPDGAWIYYVEISGGLRRVPASGGSPEILTQMDFAAGDIESRYVDVLPAGRGAVYAVRGPNGFEIQAVEVETGAVKAVTLGRFPRFSPTGHLLFVDEDGVLLGAPFDVGRMELAGPAAPLADGLFSIIVGRQPFAVSETGTLVYRTGTRTGGVSVVPAWVERDGTARDIDPSWTVQGSPIWSSLALSPDGARLVMSILDPMGTWDLWVKQLDTLPLSRLTFEGSINRRAKWSPDGQSLTFISNRAGAWDVFTKRADGSGTVDVVLDTDQQNRRRRGRTQLVDINEALYSQDGAWLVFREGGNLGGGDIFAIQPARDSVAVPLAASESGERSPALSPDGRWLAYVSTESGREEVYVSPFPDGIAGGKRQVSSGGGIEPVWAHSGRELFYRSGANDLVALQVTAGASFTLDGQEVLFSMGAYLGSDGHPMYDVSPDDQRFVMLRIADQHGGSGEVVLVQNFFEELKRLVPN